MALKRKDFGTDIVHSPKKFRRGLVDDEDEFDDLFSTGPDWDEDVDDSEDDEPSRPKITKKDNAREKKYVCEFKGCNQRFTRPSHVESHMRTHTGERPFKCPHQDCSKTYNRKDHLDRHLKAEHEKRRDYQCSWEGCDKAFYEPRLLKQHVEQVHENDKLFYCTEYGLCGKSFRKEITLQAHINEAHLGLRKYPCPHVDPDTGEQCSAGYNENAKLQQHIQDDHLNEKRKKRDNEHFFCTMCPTPGTLMETIQSANGTITVAQKPLEFSSYQEFKSHAKTVHPPKCEECDQPFSSNHALKLHLDIVHGHAETPPSFPCSEPGCGKVFNKKSNQTAHIKRVHADQPGFVCGTFDFGESKHEELKNWDGHNSCGMPLKTKSGLEQHIRKHHLGFASRKEMRQEKKKTKKPSRPEPTMLELLTGVGYERGRPIACVIPECKFRFTREYNHTLHLKTFHKLEEEEIQYMLEAQREKQALEGGQFWVGGLDETADGSTLQSVQSSVPQTPLNFPSPAYDQEPLFKSTGEPGTMFDPNWPSLGDSMTLDSVLEEEDEMDILMGISNLPKANIHDGLQPDPTF